MTDQITQNGFLGDMRTIVRGQVESLTRYEISNERGVSNGGSIWVSKPNTGQNPNNLGNELIKIKMPFEMFDAQKALVDSGKLYFPCMMEIVCRVDMGGQNKAVLVAETMKLDGPDPSVEQEQESKDKAKGVSGQLTGTTSGTPSGTTTSNTANKP